MLLVSKNKISEIIVASLAKGSLNTLDLYREVSNQKVVSKQNFYKALRGLIKEEVIAKNKLSVVLNNLWVNRLHEFVGTIDTNYQSQTHETILRLLDGESLVYHFKSLTNLDVLWKHYFFIVAKINPSEDIVFYNPHEFWSLFRFETENFMYRWILENKRTTYEIVGNNTALDKSTTAYIKNFGIQIMYESTPSLKKNVFPVIIGDYIVETILDMDTVNAINILYQTHTEWSDSLSKELNIILGNVKRAKIIISKNRRRAQKIHKKLVRKYFIF
jgi:hypothetical protein